MIEAALGAFQRRHAELAGGIAIEYPGLEEIGRGSPDLRGQGLRHGEDQAKARKRDGAALAMAANGVEIVGVDDQGIGVELRQESDLLGDVGGDRDTEKRAGLE